MTATPPPDPAPTEQPAPPPAAETAAATQTAPAPEQPPAPAPEPPKPATWPEWFGAVDVAIGMLVALLAFLVASFTARNPDLWLHLAGGRLIAHGNLHPGADPFSFTGADRPWADTSWLFDLGAYALYSTDTTGAALVVVKALAFAAAFGLLALLRRPGQALWPWAALIGLAVLAAAPYATVRPLVASMLFLSLTLLILYRRPWTPGTWRQPVELAVLFWVWANTDMWFFLGPLTVALVLLGEWLNRYLELGPATEEESVFRPAPPRPMLARALGLGVVACLLNPMVLAAAVKDPGEAAAQLLPIELGFGVPPGVEDDLDLGALVARPFTEDFYWYRPNSPAEQLKVPAVAFTVLFFGSLLALAAGFRRLRATHILLWVAFGVLACLHGRLIPFFAVIAVPLAAAHLNGLSAAIRLGPWSDTPTRVTLVGSAIGRVLTVAAALVALAAAYPGWLHSPPLDPAFANRVEWAAQPDPGLARTAGVLARLRSEGQLPADAWGLGATPDLGAYCAWFAPAEKVFVDPRYRFHRKELPDLLAVRRVLVGRRGKSDAPPDTDEVARVCDAHRAAFLVDAVPYYRRLDDRPMFALLGQEDRWVLWHLDGRSAVVGRLDGPLSAAEVNRLRFDTAREAFGPSAQRLPEGKAVQPLKTPEAGMDQFWADYLARPEPRPLEADDAELLATYGFHETTRAEQRWRRRVGASQFARAALAGVPVLLVSVDVPPIEDVQLAAPVLAVRAARRAVAAAPDRPEVYHSLSLAYRVPFAPVADVPLPGANPPDWPLPVMTEQQLQVITALARFLARVPPPDRCPSQLMRVALGESVQLAGQYQRTAQLDLARDTIRKAQAYGKALPADVLSEMTAPAAGGKEDSGKAWLKNMEDEEDRLTRQIQRATDAMQRQTTASLYQRFQGAVAAGLPRRAIQLFKDANPNDFGPGEERIQQVVGHVIALELRAGRLEDAADDLKELDQQVADLAARRPGHAFVVRVRELQQVRYRLEGNYPAAAELLNQTPVPAVNRAAAEVALTSAPEAAMSPVVPAVAGLTMAVALDPRFSKAPLAAALFEWLATRQVLGVEVGYQYDRAMLALNDADTREALRRLRLAARPQGFDPTRVADPNRLGRTRRYLELLERYQNLPPR